MSNRNTNTSQNTKHPKKKVKKTQNKHNEKITIPSHGDICEIPPKQKYKNIRRSRQGYLVICKKSKKIPFTKKRMFKTTLYTSNTNSTNTGSNKKKSKYFTNLNNKYSECLKKTCWHRLSNSDYKLSIGEIARQLPNMFNNSNGCYINSLLQLLFQMEHFNKSIMNIDDSELQGLDIDYNSKLKVYKDFLIARDNTIGTNKKIDQKKSLELLKILGFNHTQQDSSEILQTKLLGSIVDGYRIISKLFTTKYIIRTDKHCEDSTEVSSNRSENEVFINIPIIDNLSIKKLLEKSFNPEALDGEEPICKIKELSPPIIEHIRNFKRNNLENYFEDDIYKETKAIINENISTDTDNNTILVNLDKLSNDIIEKIYEVLSAERIPEEHRVKKDDLFYKSTKVVRSPSIEIHEDQKYLFIRLIIYAFDKNTSRFTKKKSKSINLDENIEINNTRFRLLGFNAHSGTFRGGHYVAYVKKQNHWFFLNDTDSSPLGIHVDLKHYKTRYDPYILLYEKVTVTEPNLN